MAAALNGAAFGSDVVDFTKNTTSPTNTGQFVVALNPIAFGMDDSFPKIAAHIFAEMRASSPLPDHDPVRLPGDGKTAAAQTRRKGGLALSPALRRDLNTLAAVCGLTTPFPNDKTG